MPVLEGVTKYRIGAPPLTYTITSSQDDAVSSGDTIRAAACSEKDQQ